MRTETGKASAKEVLDGLSAGKKAHEEGETQVEAPQQEQAVPQPAEQQPTHQDAVEAEKEAQATEQPTEQDGKESLPTKDEDEEDFEEEDEEAEPTFTDQDRADLPVLEAKVKHHGLEHSRAIREIRQRKLWMQHRNDDGSRKYKTYDQYVADFHGRSRQWATDQTQHVTMVEKLAELRAQGVDVPEMLTRTAVSGMHHLVECGNYHGDTEDEQEEAGLVAVLQEAAQDGKSLSGENLRAICNRRYRYHDRHGWRPKPLAATYDEYKKDLTIVEPLSKVDRNERNNGKIKEWADTNNATMPEAVVATYKQTCSLPDNDFLLSVATADGLKKLVDDLVALGDKIASLKEREQIAKDNNEQKRKLKQSLGVSTKSKKGGGKGANPSAATSGGQGKALSVVGEDADESDDGKQNDVQDNLETALDYLDEALNAEWPEADDGETIQAILNSAESCEKKLAEITNKAKELLADDDTPQKTPDKLPRTVKALDPSDPDAYFPDE